MDGLTVALVGLGGMIYLSKNKNKNMKEGFDTIPTDEPQSYPIPNKNIQPDDDDYNNIYKGTQTTDKFFKNIENNSELFQTTSIDSLNGQSVAMKDFKHNNMVPWFGAKMTGAAMNSSPQSILDSYTGAGSQSKRKEETAPLFKPEDNVQWAYGAPNNSDYLQSHQTVGNSRNNTKPWVETQVGPGLGKGFSSAGSGGFNSGMEDRKEWMPKSVDQLRTINNPKTIGTLGGLEGPAQSKIYNLGIEGKIEKNRPDTDYVLGPERYFTTTGAEIAQTAHSQQVMGHVNRPETNKEHYGISGTGDYQAQQAPQTYDSLAKKEHCFASDFGNPYAAGENPANKNDYANNSYYAKPNNRISTKQPTEYGIFGSVIGSVMAPVLDIIRPSRKENVIGNIRESGNIQKQDGTYVINPGDKPKTTIKEMTVGKGNHLNIQAQNEGFGAYKVTQHQPVSNQRDTTNCSEWGGAISNNPGPKPIQAYLEQRNNVNRIQTDYTPSGYEGLFNGNINADLCTNRGDCDNRGLTPNLPNYSPSIQTYGKLNGTERTSTITSERIEPNILDAFKKNPYTHSIESY